MKIEDSTQLKVVTPVVGWTSMEVLYYLWISQSLSKFVSQRCVLVHQSFIYDIEDQLGHPKKCLGGHRLKPIRLLLNRLILALLFWRDTIAIYIEFHGLALLILVFNFRIK